MVWTVCALAVLLALPALAAHADEEDLNVFEENRQDVAQAMVEQAIQVRSRKTGEAAISMMRDPENPLFRDGSVYAFLVDGEGTFLAHAAAPGLIGTSMHGLTDPEGIELGALFEYSGSPHGGWALYAGAYPDSGHEGPIKAWLVTAWGHIFGAAIHHDADSRTEIYLTERERERQDAAKEMAEKAIRTFSRDPDLAVSLIHDPDDTLFHDGELYAMVVHRNGTIVADGYAPRLGGHRHRHPGGHLGRQPGGYIRGERLGVRQVGGLLLAGSAHRLGPRGAQTDLDQGIRRPHVCGGGVPGGPGHGPR